MLSRRFAPLFWCQFFSAFSDNFLKTALVFLILFQIGGPNAEALITLAGGIFIAPFFFLSALGGQIADRFDKAMVARRLKFIEIGIAFVAVAGFSLHSVPVLFVALFLFGVIAALFGPMKYGILPDHLARAELPAANALVEGATFLAILLGTIFGGLATKGGGDPAHLSLLMIGFALLCWGSSLFIPPTGEAAPGLRDFLEYRYFNRRTGQAFMGRSAAVVGRAGLELVLAFRHHRALAVASARGQGAGRQRGGSDRVSGGIFRCRRDRLRTRGPHRTRAYPALADAGRRRYPRPLRA